VAGHEGDVDGRRFQLDRKTGFKPTASGVASDLKPRQATIGPMEPQGQLIIDRQRTVRAIHDADQTSRPCQQSVTNPVRHPFKRDARAVSTR
jgi:hypothetical protein